MIRIAINNNLFDLRAPVYSRPILLEKDWDLLLEHSEATRSTAISHLRQRSEQVEAEEVGRHRLRPEN